MRFGRRLNLKTDAMVVALIMVSVFACAVGALVLGDAADLTPAGQERQRIENEYRQEQLALDLEIQATQAADTAARLEAERPAKIAWSYGWRIAALIGIAGLIIAGVAFAVHRSQIVNANRQGQFPLLISTVDGVRVIHDPNRTVSGVTALGGEPQVKHYLPPGQPEATAQAQATQMMAALASGDPAASRRQEAARALMSASQRMLARKTPQVERAEWDEGHVEQLLIEGGQLAEEENYG